MAYLYFSNLDKGSSGTDNSLNLVSASTGMVFTFENDKSFYDILGGQSILDELLGEQKSKLLQAIRQNLVQDPKISNLITGEKVYVGFLPGVKNTIDFVIATQTKIPEFNLNKINELKNLQVKADSGFHQLTFPDSTSCFVGVNRKSILISNSLETLKKLVGGDGKQNSFANYIKENNRFNKNTLANIYIDYNKIPSLLKNILNSNLTGELSILNEQNSYAALSYNFGSDKLLLNGYTALHDLKSYYQLFVKQPQQKITIDQLLPDNTANYMIFAINDYERWYKELTTWHQEKNKDKQIEKQFAALNQKYRIDIKETFPKYFQQQFALFQLNTGEKLGIIKLKNGDKLAQLLLDLSTEYSAEIRIFNDAGLLYDFFGEPFKKFDRPFYTIIDNHLVVANNASSLQVFLSRYKNNDLLNNTSDYLYFKDQMSNSATICIYVNQKNSNTIFGRNLKSPYYKQFKSKNGFKDYSAFAYQLSADNGKFMSNILLLKNQKPIILDSLPN